MTLPAQPNLSLLNGLACLEVVITAGEPVGSREVARVLDLEHTRVSRLLQTLRYLHLVEQDARRKYRPGSGLHVLSAQSLAGSGLLAAALPHVRELQAENLLVAMGVLGRQHVCYLVHAGAGTDLADRISAHRPMPAWDSVLGLALLACRDPKEVDRYLQDVSGLPAARKKTIRQQIAAARRDGYAHRKQGDETGLAVVIGDPPIAAISLTGEIDGRTVPRLVHRLQTTAQAIEADLPA